MKSYLGLTVLAAVVTTLGTLLALFIKEFLLVRYFDEVRETKALKNISKKYKDPILVAGSELARRIAEIMPYPEWISKGFKKEVLFSKSATMQSINFIDPYFLNYKFLSTLYRFCAFFGWLELYRQDITFLNSYSKLENVKSSLIVEKLKTTIADGNLNTDKDRKNWKDVLIFREEQRSIGEGMIESINNQKNIIGYGKFQNLIENFENTQKPNFLRPVITFFTDFRVEKDFRFERLEQLRISLHELVKCLDEDYYKVHLMDQ